MKRLASLVILILVAATLSGCFLFRRPETDVSRTPNQVLWQLRTQVVQLSRDVEDLHVQNLISDARYGRLRRQVERAASEYNRLKRAYVVYQKLDASSVDAVRLSLSIVVRELATVKGATS